ncbi:MAG TPA: acyl-CoA dehydrogenase family protein [Candidatus Binataceae bacterium]|nr:acyl-CoA dehydrogenase family protein [Candidatus Binataceae bacterium]
MDFELTTEQIGFRDTVRQFAEREVRPIAEELDARGEFHYALVPKMAELGLFGVIFPEKYGGLGVDTLTYSLVLEELARVDSSVAATVAGQVNLCGDLIYRLGTEAQRDKWLRPLIRGEMLGAFGLTEPSAGSDAGGTRTRAERVGDNWVINGSKCFISNAGTRMKEIVVIAAVTGSGPSGKKLTSALVVESGTPGFRAGKQYRKMGWRSSATAELIFEDCRIPAANLLGVEGRGFKQFLETLNLGRIAIASLGVGLAQGCLEMALAYAKNREQFGQPISKFQAIQFKLADMAVKVELARLITHKAAALRDYGKPFAMEAAMAKLYGAEIATEVSHQAIQVHGGTGFMDDCAVSRFYRDARILEIGEGTSEIQRLVIARNLGC